MDQVTRVRLRAMNLYRLGLGGNSAAQLGSIPTQALSDDASLVLRRQESATDFAIDHPTGALEAANRKNPQPTVGEHAWSPGKARLTRL